MLSVKPLARYQAFKDPGGSGSLAQAAAYLGAPAGGGAGVKVAVLDSGIDFTHEYLGGPGTVGAYQACYQGAYGKAYNSAPTGICANFFGASNRML